MLVCGGAPKMSCVSDRCVMCVHGCRGVQIKVWVYVGLHACARVFACYYCF